ncbi:MAG: cation-transporting P-type ATPase [Acidobacteriia bacterium]|nr:cation-transporting P-type ATPase [Terriglobia bacterium]
MGPGAGAVSEEQTTESIGVQARPLESGGLTAQEAALRRLRYGANLLPRPRPLPVWRHLLAQLVHFFAVMLWIAGGLAILAGMPQLGLAIFVVIVLNGLFAFFQEYRAEKAGERLRDLLPRRATVLRGGSREEIDAAELVPGDAVLLSAGDRICADLRLDEVHGLSVDTSTLTGESVPATPQIGGMLFAGTFALEGEARGTVTATGKATRLAEIAQMTAAGRRPPSPLALELDRVVRIIALVAVAVGSVFLLIALLVGIRLSDGFLFALGVTVALVPEGLLPTVTLSLAMGAQRMAARGALVRRLESVETLGSTTFICTDKTGTLTRNEMAVVEAWTPGGRAFVEGQGYEPEGTVRADAELLPALREMALAAARCSNGRAVLRDGRWMAQGNPLDAALDVFARRLQVDVPGEEAAAPAVRRYAFDPRRRRMSIVAGPRVYVKGAPEAVFACCRETGDAEEQVARMAGRGLRVLAIAARAARGLKISDTPEAIETDLTLLGLVGIEDPPRQEVAASIAACRRAGIRVAMVTGDHPETARAIAREVGLLNSEGMVVEGKELPRDEEILGALLDRDGVVVSRVSPEEKLRIARALRRRGHVVAMTGDGVNDAPALQEANIGVAMGLCGTDVAREAADLVLLDDNFATIVAAIEQGRTTFSNARRFLTYHLTDNVAELTPFVIWALSGGRFPLAIGVLQVLCLDIGTDILPAVALGAESSSPRALSRPPQGRHLVDMPLLIRAFCVLGPVESLVEMLAFLAAMFFAGWRPGAHFPGGPVFLAASGAAFTAVVVGQLANAFACRSASLWPGKLGWLSNRYLVLAVLCELGMLAGFLYIAPLARVLGQAPPSAAGYLTALLAFPAVLLADALHKEWKRRRHLNARG